MFNPVKMILARRKGGVLPQFLVALSASLTVFTAGIHFGWTAPSLTKIMSDEYPFEVSKDEASYIAISTSIGHVIGGVFGTPLMDIFGRKWTILLITIPHSMSLLLIYLSFYGKYMLYIARVLAGVGEGCSLAVLPIFFAEIAEPKVRGVIGILTSTAFVLGSIFINLTGSYLDLHTTAVICLTFPILQWLIFTNMPDSPYYLLIKEKREEALDSLKILRSSEKVDIEYNMLCADVKRQMSESGTFKDIFTIPSNRKAFILVSFSRLFQQFTGASAFFMYYQILIEESTNLSPVIGSTVLMMVQLVVNTAVSFLMDRMGRRPMFIISSALCSCVLFILATFFVIEDYTTIDVSSMAWFPLIMMVLFVVSFSLGLSGVLNVFFAEIYSASIKAKAYSLGSIMFACVLMSSVKFYQYTADNVGKAVPFYSFAICTLIGAIFFYFFVPETKGKTLETIQQELKGNIKTPNVNGKC